MEPLTIRPGETGDIAPLDALFARSYPRLLAPDYPPSVLVTAIPRIARAQPRLVTCGTYFVAFKGDHLVGAGGWTRALPGNAGRGEAAVGHIRHFVTDANAVRQGIGRALINRTIESAVAAGVARLECLSTRTAVPFYASAGFVLHDEVAIDLAPGVTFPALRMTRQVRP